MFMMIDRQEGFSAKEYEEFCDNLFCKLTGRYQPSWFLQDSLVMGCYLNQFFIDILNTEPMQNSRGKVQTAYTYKQNPRMEYCSRYDHMIHAFILGLDFLMIQEKKGIVIDDKTKISFLVFLLTHDIGHGPFSHPFEVMVDGYKGMHEDIGRRTILENKGVREAMDKIYPGLAQDVVDFKKNDKYGLASLLEGIFDFDRAAFMIDDTFECDGMLHPNKSIYIVEDLKRSIYNIMNNIVLKDGNVYYDNACLRDIEFFLKTRKENYEVLYCSPDRILYDEILAKIGSRVLELNLDEMQYSPDDKNALYYKKIVDFTSFIREMKAKHKDVDLDMYHSFQDSDFNNIFFLLQLVDDYELNEYCHLCASEIEEMINDYSVVEFATEEEMREYQANNPDAFIVKSKVKVYESTEEENIRFLMEDGTVVDLGDHLDRLLDIETSFKYYGFKKEKKIALSDDDYEQFFEIMESTIQSELDIPDNMYPNIDGELLLGIHTKMMEIREFLYNGGSISEYMASSGESLREIVTILLSGTHTKKLKTCAQLLLVPQSDLGSVVKKIDYDSMDKRREVIKDFQRIVVNDEPNECENNYHANYIFRNTLFCNADISSLIVYKPLLNKTSNYSNEARDEVRKLFGLDSTVIKSQFLSKKYDKTGAKYGNS